MIMVFEMFRTLLGELNWVLVAVLVVCWTVLSLEILRVSERRG